MTRQDEVEFLDYVRTTGDVLIIPGAAETHPLEEANSYRYFFDLGGRRLGDFCYLWNRSISPVPEFTWDAKDAYFYLRSISEAEVLSPMRCTMVEGALSMGRLYIDHERLDEAGHIAKKNKAFIDWYDKLCRWIRKHYKHRFDGAYTSARVREEVEKGLKLTGHCF